MHAIRRKLDMISLRMQGAVVPGASSNHWFRHVLNRHAEALLRAHLSGSDSDPFYIDAGGWGGPCTACPPNDWLESFAREFSPPARLQHLRGELTDIPIASDTVSAVVALSHQHLTHKDRCLAELTRILKPGGLLLVGLPELYPDYYDPADLHQQQLSFLELLSPSRSTLHPLSLQRLPATFHGPAALGHRLSAPPRPLNAILHLAFLAVSSLKLGPNLIALARKTQPSTLSPHEPLEDFHPGTISANTQLV